MTEIGAGTSTKPDGGAHAGLDAVVVGAGPAGLATSWGLSRHGIAHVVLERGDVGHCWRGLYDSFHLNTGKHLSSLPGRPFPAGTSLFPTRSEWVDYLTGYARHFRLPVWTGQKVTAIEALGTVNGRGARWRVRTATTNYEVPFVVAATGVMTHPRMPPLEGLEAMAGRYRHSLDYHRPAEYRGKRVLVVGAGTSAGEVATDLALGGVTVEMSVRSGNHIYPKRLLGIPAQYWLVATPPPLRKVTDRLLARNGKGALPPPAPGSAPVAILSDPLADLVRTGRVGVRPGVQSVWAGGVHFDDGLRGSYDEIIFATGFSPAVCDLADVPLHAGEIVVGPEGQVPGAEGFYVVGPRLEFLGGLRRLRRLGPACAGHIAGQLRGLG